MLVYIIIKEMFKKAHNISITLIQYIICVQWFINRFRVVKVTVLESSAVDRKFESRSSQTKYL